MTTTSDRTGPDRRVHELKIWPEFFDAIHRGDKTFELRRDDRGFRAGDVLHLREWDRGTKFYTGQSMWVEVTYLMSGFGLELDFVCMSIARSGVADSAQFRSAVAEAKARGDDSP